VDKWRDRQILYGLNFLKRRIRYEKKSKEQLRVEKYFEENNVVHDGNCIYVLDKGEIIESGTHTKLLQQKGTYYKMYQLQAGMLNVEKTSN